MSDILFDESTLQRPRRGYRLDTLEHAKLWRNRGERDLATDGLVARVQFVQDLRRAEQRTALNKWEDEGGTTSTSNRSAL